MAHSSGGGGHHGGSSSHVSRSSYHTRRMPSRKNGSFSPNGSADSGFPFWILLTFYSFLLVLLLIPLKRICFVPQKIENTCSQILIEDNLPVITEKEALNRTLIRFYEETGVTPAIKIVHDNVWIHTYPTMLDYAMEEYYRLFDDEKHWLIVYSVSMDDNGNIPIYGWSFEGIIGDDTGPSINERLCDEFTQDMSLNLLSCGSGETTLEDAIGETFSKLLEKRDIHYLFLNRGMMTVFGIIFCVLYLPMIILIVAAICSQTQKSQKQHSL